MFLSSCLVDIRAMNNLKFDTICLNQRDNIQCMPRMNIPHMSNCSCGLTNQLFALAHAVLKKSSADFLVVDSFLTCIENGTLCCVSDFIDLEKTTQQINKIILLEQVKLIDRMNVDVDLLSVNYGIKDVAVVDVTQYFTQMLSIDKKINIPSSMNFNDVFGCDPCRGFCKILYMDYRINGYTIHCELDEYEKNLLIDPELLQLNIFSKAEYDFGWYNSVDEEKFINILNAIVFSEKMYAIIHDVNRRHALNDVNVIQLRVEDDSIAHWSNQNNMHKKVFTQKLYEQYRIAVVDCFNNNNKTLVLTGSTDKISKVFAEVNKDNFIAITSEEKTELLETAFGYSGRELRAAIDLLLGKTYGINFVGCHSPTHKRGSTFGYYLAKNIKGNVALIDLDCIDNPVSRL